MTSQGHFPTKLYAFVEGPHNAAGKYLVWSQSGDCLFFNADKDVVAQQITGNPSACYATLQRRLNDWGFRASADKITHPLGLFQRERLDLLPSIQRKPKKHSKASLTRSTTPDSSSTPSDPYSYPYVHPQQEMYPQQEMCLYPQLPPPPVTVQPQPKRRLPTEMARSTIMQSTFLVDPDGKKQCIRSTTLTFDHAVFSPEFEIDDQTIAWLETLFDSQDYSTFYHEI